MSRLLITGTGTWAASASHSVLVAKVAGNQVKQSLIPVQRLAHGSVGVVAGLGHIAILQQGVGLHHGELGCVFHSTLVEHPVLEHLQNRRIHI